LKETRIESKQYIKDSDVTFQPTISLGISAKQGTSSLSVYCIAGSQNSLETPEQSFKYEQSQKLVPLSIPSETSGKHFCPSPSITLRFKREGERISVAQ